MGDFLEISKSCGLGGRIRETGVGKRLPLGKVWGQESRREPYQLHSGCWLISLSFYLRVLTCGRKLLGLWPATQENSSARWSAPNFHQPDSVILQVRPSLFPIRLSQGTRVSSKAPSELWVGTSGMG